MRSSPLAAHLRPAKKMETARHGLNLEERQPARPAVTILKQWPTNSWRIRRSCLGAGAGGRSRWIC